MRSALSNKNNEEPVIVDVDVQKLHFDELYPNFVLAKHFNTQEVMARSFASMQLRAKNAVKALLNSNLDKVLVLCGSAYLDSLKIAYQLLKEIQGFDNNITIAYAPNKFELFGNDKEEGIVTGSGIVIMPISHLNDHPKWLGMLDAVLAQNNEIKLVLCGDAQDCAQLSLFWPFYVNTIQSDLVLYFPSFNAPNFIAALVKSYIEEYGLPHFNGDAITLLCTYLARLSSDRRYIFIPELKLISLCLEASQHAKQGSVVGKYELLKAIAANDYRTNLLAQEQLQEHRDRQILVQTKGQVIGQINGLSVIESAGSSYVFGEPVRITATLRAGGEGDVIDIERKAELAGQIHAKAMMIINGFLTKEFGSTQPLPVSASLVFEQSYLEVDGDSASLTGLCAVLSCLAKLPIRQDLAVTGAVDQFGHVQAVGGVNEKIEGFFKVCRLHGLTKTQGVIIPRACVEQLVLRPSVVKAVKDGVFHIYTVNHVKDAMFLLTNTPYGDETLKDSVFERIISHLSDITSPKEESLWDKIKSLFGVNGN